MPTRKAPGPDGITMPILKMLKEQMANSIALLINRCILDGEFPNGWKEAVVVPIPKKDNSSDPNDYRPISLLPIVSKIAEAYFFTCLYPVINESLSECQFGFRKMRSTTDALFYFEHRVTTGFNECKKGNSASKVGAVFFDVRKAFDTVPHHRLLKRLQDLNLPPNWLNFMSSYLLRFKNRSFKTRVGKATSQEFKITTGVPQGSVLVPLLFLAYVDQIFEVKLSASTRLILYAYDLAYVKPIPSPKE
uniref:Reverse transcriptase domain-containing protein n=1 Tax=Acrobeloides nanus TaxID=290746 RepID=A0A914DXK2_9BILA